MATSTLRAVRSEARAISAPVAALAAGEPTGGAILALDLGQKTGWAVRNADGAIASGTVAVFETPGSSPIAIEWRIIPGWPDYEVSEWGDVRRRTPARNARPGMVLAPFYRKNGYAQLQLNANRRRRRFLVHRLVAIAFVGPQSSPAHEIAHLNGNRAHNHHSNLRWVLHRENEDHKHQHGTRQRGSRIGNSRLTEEQVGVIKAELRRGKTQTELGARFRISVSTVSLIARGEIWRHVP
jgi:HNH endonuclease/NUMOD4 motif